MEGAEDAVETLERQIGKAKALGKDYSQLESQLKQARAAIDEFKQSGQASEGETEQLSTATEKLTLKHADLKSMLKGAAAEFPLLGRLGQLALNPIAGAVAAITAGYALWRRRIEETAAALQSLELPDLSTNHIGMVSAATTAWQGYGDAVRRAREELASASATAAQVDTNIQEAMRRQLELIRAIQEFARTRAQAEGRPTAQIDLDADAVSRATAIQARRQQLQNRENEAAALEAEAARKRAAAGGIGTASASHDATMQGKLDEAAKTPNAHRDKQFEEIDTIHTALTPGAPGRQWASMKLKLQQLWTGMSPQELRAQAQRQADSDLEIERGADRFRASGPERERERARREELLSGAANSQTKADQIRSGLPAERTRIDADERANAEVLEYARRTAEIQRQQEEARRAQEAERERARENERLNRDGRQQLHDDFQNRPRDVSSAGSPSSPNLPTPAEDGNGLLAAFEEYHSATVASQQALAERIRSLAQHLADSNTRFTDSLV